LDTISNKHGKKLGSVIGFAITVGIGFLIYILLINIKVETSWLDYNTIVANAHSNLFYKTVWYIMNFTEAQFYAGFFASLGVILGGFVAWRLDVKDSKYAGFNVSYGSNLWPWVFASQLLTLFISIFILGFTRYFEMGYTWLPTFIMVVGAPPAIMLIYGPNVKALFTGSILGAFMGFPVAMWISDYILPVIDVPGVVSNVFTMAITGIIIAAICNVLPWMEKMPSKPIERREKNKDNELEYMHKPLWFIRRVFADFSEAQFYGNEIAGLFVIFGASLDWILNMNHGAYGSGVIPAIILSQIIGSAVGVFLYFSKFVDSGWYGTYVPVVSVGPASVLMFGGTIQVAVLAGILGGIIGPPMAEYFCSKLKEGYHPTIGNVTSMGVTTIIVTTILKIIL